ncbi:MAG: HEAT repeat domain-containing protein [Bradymonadia bacterium]
MPLLLAAALDPAQEVRRFAAASLPAARPLPQARQALARLTRDGDKKARLLAVIGMLEIFEGAEGHDTTTPVVPDAVPSDDGLPPITWLIDGAGKALRDPGLAHAATRALGLCGHPAAKAPLTRLARKLLGDPFVKLEAAASLVRLGDDSHAPALIKAVQGRKRMLRPMAAALLGELKILDGRAALEQMLLDPREPHAYTAAEALAELGEAAATPALTRAADTHPDPETREAARKALEILEAI